jgi:hypothetical protein
VPVDHERKPAQNQKTGHWGFTSLRGVAGTIQTETQT